MIEIKVILEGKKYNISAIVENGRCYFKNFFEGLIESEKKKLVALLKRTADEGVPHNNEKFRKLENDLWEFKSYQSRVMCTFYEEKIILLMNCFIKKSQKTPRNELERARRLLKEVSKGGIR